MRFVRRFAVVPALVLAVGAAWVMSSSAASAYTPMVTMVDNDGTLGQQGFDVGTGYWGYGPSHIVVKKGEQVVFTNPPTNKRPHTVTSIGGGMPFESTANAGSAFDSSPTREALVTVGTSWTLDTNAVNVGHYGYYCRIHPWMVGSITVTE